MDVVGEIAPSLMNHLESDSWADLPIFEMVKLSRSEPVLSRLAVIARQVYPGKVEKVTLIQTFQWVALS